MTFTPDMNDDRHIFVFGSNLAGRHGAGAALEAKEHWGAQLGVDFGRTGQAFAIPTKDERLRSLFKSDVKSYVSAFLDYAEAHSELTFLVTAIGTGLAGFSHKNIAPMFNNAPDNCVLPTEWAGITA